MLMRTVSSKRCASLLLLAALLGSRAMADGPAPYETHAVHDVNGVTENRDTSFDLNTEIDLVTEVGEPIDAVRDRQGQMWGYADQDGRVRASIDTNVTLDYDSDIIDGLEVPPSFRNSLYWGQTFIKGASNEPTTATLLPSTVELNSYTVSGLPSEYVIQWPHAGLFFEITVSHVARLEGATWVLLDNITPESVLWVNQELTGYADDSGLILVDRSGKVPTIFRRRSNETFRIDIPYYVHEFDLSHIPEGDLFRIEYTIDTTAATPPDMASFVYFADPLKPAGEDGGVLLDIPHQRLDAQSPRACGEVFDAGRYRNNEDGTVTDVYTSLMWQRCPVGFELNDAGTPANLADDGCNETGAVNSARSWQATLQDAQDDTSAGHDDWRLPNVKELESLTGACFVPALETDVFPDTPVRRGFWTSTPDADPRRSEIASWQINFANGELQSVRRDDAGFRRLVRDTGATPVEPLPALAAGRGTATEGNNGTVQLSIPIALSRPANTDVTVDYSVSDTLASATAGVDFEGSTGTVVIPAGETRAEVMVNVIGDGEAEPDETVQLRLSNNSANSRLRIATSLSTIVDDEAVLQFAAHPTQAAEGASGGGTAFGVPVLLDRPAESMVTVDYRLEDDSGVVGTDIAAASGSLIFNVGEHAAVIDLTTIGDDLPENDETIRLVLTNPTGAKLTAGSGGEMTQTVRIVDDDGAGTYTALNDSGMLTCANDSSVSLSCPQTGYANQDGDIGRDADPATNSSSDGHGGFSFTKLDRGGFELVNQNGSYFAGPWACLVDEVTGLVWEVKTPNINNPVEDNDLHSDRWTYSWYDSDGIGDGGDAGTENGGSCFVDGECDTEKFIAAVNATNHCGFNDWRLPTIDELYSIVNFNQTGLRHDTVFFPNLRLGSGTSGRVWSSTPGAPSLGSGETAWMLNGNGISRSQKQTAGKVRLVRGGSQ